MTMIYVRLSGMQAKMRWTADEALLHSLIQISSKRARKSFKLFAYVLALYDERQLLTSFVRYYTKVDLQ